MSGTNIGKFYLFFDRILDHRSFSSIKIEMLTLKKKVMSTYLEGFLRAPIYKIP